MQRFTLTHFDIQRATIRPQPLFTPLQSPPEIDLTEAIARGYLRPDDQVLMLTGFNMPRVIPILNMVYYHVAQGRTENVDWMLSFCLICNSGVVFSSTLENITLTFTERGIYNAMTLLSDNETDSLWNPLTGECLHGKLAGKRLSLFSTPRQMTAQIALDSEPTARFLISTLQPDQATEAAEWDVFRRQPTPDLPERWIKTMGSEDTRLPRLEMGLGIWSNNAARYYPYRDLNAHDNLIVDQFDGRSLIVYIDPESSLPEAFYIASAEVRWMGDDLSIKGVGTIRHGVLYPPAHESQHLERPDQLFMRWYGFAFTFPNCEIYQAKHD